MCKPMMRQDTCGSITGGITVTGGMMGGEGPPAAAPCTHAGPPSRGPAGLGPGVGCTPAVTVKTMVNKSELDALQVC